MKFRQLGSTDLSLSEIGFGLWTLSTEAWGSVQESSAIDLLVAAYELGINYFDTSDSDGEGFGEELLGKALGQQRHDIVISTKVGYDFYDRLAIREHGGLPANFEPDYVRQACEKTLRRLGTDHIDLYQLHHPRADVLEDDELFYALDELVNDGKIRYWGISLGPGLDVREEGEAAIAEREFSGLQLPYNILDQQPGRSLLQIAAESDSAVGFVMRSPHASGLIDGTYTKNTKLKRDDELSDEAYETLRRGIRNLAELDFLTDNMDSTLGQIAINFVLKEPRVASVLPNIRSADRLREFAAASETRDIPQQMVDRLIELHDDYFHSSDEESDAD